MDIISQNWAQCAPAVHPATIEAVVAVESGGNPYAIGINAPVRLRRQAASEAEAVDFARYLLAHGYDIDVGLAQINVRNLARLGLPLEHAFRPCENLRAMATLLGEAYTDARRGTSGTDPQAALRAALSAYNTGDFSRGMTNGYVARVIRQAAMQHAGALPGGQQRAAEGGGQ